MLSSCFVLSSFFMPSSFFMLSFFIASFLIFLDFLSLFIVVFLHLIVVRLILFVWSCFMLSCLAVSPFCAKAARDNDRKHMAINLQIIFFMNSPRLSWNLRRHTSSRPGEMRFKPESYKRDGRHHTEGD